MSKNIAIFASGSGSNAENIYDYFQHRDDVQIVLIVTNNPYAKVIERAVRLSIPHFVIDKPTFSDNHTLIDQLQSLNVDLIVLAGFLWLIPTSLIEAFPNKIINIHPALLPKYGGKGMYGDNVHKAVIENAEKESGITIHFVNQNYDEGQIIFQVKCEITTTDTPESLAQKIHALEYQHFPAVIDGVLSKIN